MNEKLKAENLRLKREILENEAKNKEIQTELKNNILQLREENFELQNQLKLKIDNENKLFAKNTSIKNELNQLIQNYLALETKYKEVQRDI